MSKRPPSPALIPNPFVKKRNLAWTLDSSPVKHNDTNHNDKLPEQGDPETLDQSTSTAAIEAGQVHITDHLAHFTNLLSSHVNPDSGSASISIQNYSKLYSSSIDSAHGSHFVIHQHDHPVAGTHYDLRLQINETSSASWAIMYGLPGDPNSKRLNRNATETRIHCLWNHLVETASVSTGSLLIWDTGTYSILPRTSKYAPSHDPSSQTSSPPSSPSSAPPTQQQLLHAAFKNRKIRVRLHGSKLPDPYVLNLRLTKPEDAQGRLRSSRPPKFRRRRAVKVQNTAPETSSDSGSDSDPDDEPEEADHEPETKKGQIKEGVENPHITSPTERELLELEDHQVRSTNAYPGATNSIGSIHQRRWYLSIDRAASGFIKPMGKTQWELREDGEGGGGERLKWPFYVRGADDERSVVTGRKGNDILQDEGVKGFTQRKGWKPVLN